MKAGFLQFKPEFGEPEKNIHCIEELVKDKNFDLLVMPELANSGYLFSSVKELQKCSEEIPNGMFCKSLQNISSSKNAFIVSGICEREGDKFYNSSILVYPNGVIKTYRKIHLFNEEKNWFTPGNFPLEVYYIENERVGKLKIGMMICFDWAFPETARTLALKGAQILCHPSNLVMKYCQQAMFTRAVENHIFTITANRTGKDINGGKEISFTGVSVMIDPGGNYLARGSENGNECVIVDIDPIDALNKNISPMNNLFEDRREEFYS
jgi:predicted amidohydrolase